MSTTTTQTVVIHTLDGMSNSDRCSARDREFDSSASFSPNQPVFPAIRKEKDLELAAKIGQSLLEQNRDLQARNEFLDEQLNVSHEAVTQLRHELQRKIDLLHMYVEAQEEDDDPSTPTRERRGYIDVLQRKMTKLEEENSNLKNEALHLKKLTTGLEEKEQQLVSDCVRQLEAANERIEVLQEDITDKTAECNVQSEE
uniref:HAP1 N-terminal domain-containing protein n=1 Tax=Plectus sambesii TaxID=2011161 RepID=A0A914WCA7_9BILA